MECYFKARKTGLTSSNIIAGWKLSRLLPVSVERPLMNSMTRKTEEYTVTPPELVVPLSKVTDQSLIWIPGLVKTREAMLEL